jgi:hypothetical protein
MVITLSGFFLEAGNLPAQAFWKKVIARYMDNTYLEEEKDKVLCWSLIIPFNKIIRLSIGAIHRLSSRVELPFAQRIT